VLNEIRSIFAIVRKPHREVFFNVRTESGRQQDSVARNVCAIYGEWRRAQLGINGTTLAIEFMLPSKAKEGNENMIARNKSVRDFSPDTGSQRIRGLGVDHQIERSSSTFLERVDV
jgi:hypothetical protein